MLSLKGKNGQLYVYADHVEIKRKGLLSFLTHGTAGDKTIPYTAIQSVQLKKGSLLVNGYIQFGILGAIERSGGIYNATDDENAVVFSKGSNDDAEKIKIFIEEKIFALKSTTATTNIIQSTPADEVLKLKQLLDAGILTKEEFELKKKQILGL